MNKLSLTTQQAAVLAFLQNFMDANGFPPSRGEIAAHFKFKSENAAQCHLKALEKKKRIQLFARPRGIRILSQPQFTAKFTGLVCPHCHRAVPA